MYYADHALIVHVQTMLMETAKNTSGDGDIENQSAVRLGQQIMCCVDAIVTLDAQTIRQQYEEERLKTGVAKRTKMPLELLGSLPSSTLKKRPMSSRHEQGLRRM
mmetsp:Transcript_7513/g.13685  ORF Transcript_7513/g.13685 Transcript_7513/m.13685 type:complete len:105 (+) Transcript_7513:308-622(+)